MTNPVINDDDDLQDVICFLEKRYARNKEEAEGFQFCCDQNNEMARCMAAFLFSWEKVDKADAVIKENNLVTY